MHVTDGFSCLMLEAIMNILIAYRLRQKDGIMSKILEIANSQLNFTGN